MRAKVAVVDEYGAFLAVKDGRLQLRVRKGGENAVKWDFSPVELDSIVFAVDGASLSASAIEVASKFGIDIAFLNGMKPVARLVPATYGSAMRTWLCQLRAFRDSSKRLELARLFVEGKVHNQRMILLEYTHLAKRSGSRGPYFWGEVEAFKQAEVAVGNVSSVEEAMNVEAHLARIYWGCVAQLLPSELGFEKRIPRSRASPGNPPDPFNVALNIGYSCLMKEAWRAAFLAGLNPYVGFLHKPRAGRMSLVLDLMEEFRPVCVDRPLIAMARRGPETILKLGGESGRDTAREVWKAVLNHMTSSSQDYRSLMASQARLLAKHLRGTDRYRPYKADW